MANRLAGKILFIPLTRGAILWGRFQLIRLQKCLNWTSLHLQSKFLSRSLTNCFEKWLITSPKWSLNKFESSIQSPTVSSLSWCEKILSRCCIINNSQQVQHTDYHCLKSSLRSAKLNLHVYWTRCNLNISFIRLDKSELNPRPLFFPGGKQKLCHTMVNAGWRSHRVPCTVDVMPSISIAEK